MLDYPEFESVAYAEMGYIFGVFIFKSAFKLAGKQKDWLVLNIQLITGDPNYARMRGVS